MPTRKEILSRAVDDCMKELYSLATPTISLEEFLEENKEYLKKEEEYFKIPKENRPDYRDYMGPRPYEFYYLPKEIFKDVAESYVYAYKIDEHKNLIDIIEILKNYCKEPIVDKYIEGELREDGTRWPGHRGYDHPDNLKIEIKKKLEESPIISMPPSNKEEYYAELSEKLQNKFFEFLDMAGNFFNWNGELNAFNTNVYLGASPNSNKQAVIDNWKEYRNKDIEIDEEQIKKDYYGDDE